MAGIRSNLRCALFFAVLAACAPMGVDNGRFLVYFDEFSANLTPEARAVLADAAKRARETSSRLVRIEARASATGSPAPNPRPRRGAQPGGRRRAEGRRGQPGDAAADPDRPDRLGRPNRRRAPRRYRAGT